VTQYGVSRNRAGLMSTKCRRQVWYLRNRLQYIIILTYDMRKPTSLSTTTNSLSKICPGTRYLQVACRLCRRTSPAARWALNLNLNPTISLSLFDLPLKSSISAMALLQQQIHLVFLCILPELNASFLSICYLVFMVMQTSSSSL
jgi:hypothetical protein